jgi:AcrR family transcriptional regulator
VTGVRELRRLETRARLFDCAVSEIARRGLAAADVSAIAAEAGVVRGTFYFHFPTKEHVLIELERDEETRIVSELGDVDGDVDGDMESVLSQLINLVLEAQQRLGAVVFADMLGMHFSSTQGINDELAQHPLAEFVSGVFRKAQAAERVTTGVDAGELAMFFLTGMFALLTTGADDRALLSRYVTTIVKGMENR